METSDLVSGDGLGHGCPKLAKNYGNVLIQKMKMTVIH